MRMLIISCVYPPEPVVSSQTSAQIVQELVQRGHDVIVITSFPNRPAGKIYPGYSRRLFQAENKDGYRLIRCFGSISTKSQIFSRLMENITFGVTACLAALTVPKPAVVYSNTWPIFAAGLMWLASWLRRVPMVISIQDMYPESLISQKRLHPHGHVAKILRSIDGFLARRCAGVIAISSRFGDLYHNDRGVATERIHVIPNWIDGRVIDPDDPRAVIVRSRFNLPANARLAVYGGNIGVAAGVETLIEAIRCLENESGFHLLVAGEGSQLAICQDLAQQVSPDRIAFCTPWPKDETSSVLSAADFLILPTRGRQSLASVPSKLITYMLSAKPVLSLAWPDSDLANIVEQSGCGWVVEPDRPDLLAAQIKRVMDIDANELSQRGLAGRQYALANFSKEVCLPRVIDILDQVAV
jgi:glycosyltransferase involved in cell wall biosynthesis